MKYKNASLVFWLIKMLSLGHVNSLYDTIDCSPSGSLCLRDSPGSIMEWLAMLSSMILTDSLNWTRFSTVSFIGHILYHWANRKYSEFDTDFSVEKLAIWELFLSSWGPWALSSLVLLVCLVYLSYRLYL